MTLKRGGKNNAWQAQILLCFRWNFCRNKSGLWKRSEWECLGALLCHETTYWWMRKLTAKPQTGPLDSRGGSVGPPNVFCQQIWSRGSHGVARPPREQIGGRRKSVLGLNLYLSLVYLWPQLFCFCWVLSTFQRRMIFGCAIRFDWSKEEGGGTFGLLPHINWHVSCSVPTLPSANTTTPITFRISHGTVSSEIVWFCQSEITFLNQSLFLYLQQQHDQSCKMSNNLHGENTEKMSNCFKEWRGEAEVFEF